jgi:orotidine-5'-phosphate decarboxylase
MKFQKKLDNIIKKNNSLLCIGLDPYLNLIPKYLLKKSNDPIFDFNKKIIDSTYDLVCAYKPQIAYFASQGIKGFRSLSRTISYIKKNYPQIPIILDAKRADIGSTSEQYAKEAFDVYSADAVTVNPYFGYDSLLPFLKYQEKGIIILCKTSNKSSADFQDVKTTSQIPLYLHVAKKVNDWNRIHKNCLIVAGATWSSEIGKLRKILPEMFFLIPGIGTQGGNLKETLKNGLRKDKSGLIITSSRAIIFSENPRQQALELKKEINEYRNL